MADEVERVLVGPDMLHPFAYRLRRKLCLLYSETLIYRRTKLKGWLTLQAYKRLYPNFHVGKAPRVWGRFYVTMHAPFETEVVLGDNLHMVSDIARAGITLFSPCKFNTLGQGQIIVGDNVQLNGTAISSRKKVEIGSGSLVAPNVVIVDSDFHAPWPPGQRGLSDPTPYDREVVIGENVWLGLNATVLKGAKIGDNSIIGAGSVVAGEIPANVVAAGVPACVVKSLA